MIKIFTILIALKNLVCPCNKMIRGEEFERAGRDYKIKRISRLAPEVNECSGLELAEEAGVFYANNDSGGKPELYKIDRNGNLIETISLNGIKNRDWEDLAKDDSGAIYIGDFGNNSNRRKDLKIYKVYNGKIDSIMFSYPDQTEFPPSSKKNRNFDMEAFFWYNDSLYLFSKNWGDKKVKFYRLPDRPGSYKADLLGRVTLKNMITSADISPDGKQFVLLSYGKVYLFNNVRENGFAFQPYQCKRFARSGQAEAIVYINNEELLITNEGGKVFLMKKRKAR
ncbi:MAG TPA: hypothetical protein VIK89_02025 [Cytophagaceae bacterium]